jgi:glutaconate CoA-transferase subunit A
MARFVALDEMARLVPDGATVAIGTLSPIAFVRALAERGVRDLDLVGVPTGGLAVDILIGAGCARSVETSGVDLGEHGFAPNFSRAAEEGALKVVDSSCPALLAALQAGAAGVSFAPVPGLLGSDLVSARPDWRVVADPFQPARQVVLVPAMRPEFALIHALRADADGNLVTTIEFDDRLLVQASHRVLATVETVDEDATERLLADEQVIPAAYLEAIAVVRGGARPLGCHGRWPEDAASIRAYLDSARGARLQA